MRKANHVESSLAAAPRFTAAEISVTHDMRYREGASQQWALDLARPNAPAGGPRPAIVVIHGGGWIEGDKSSFATAEHHTPGNIVDFARLGFVAATMNDRLSGEARHADVTYLRLPGVGHCPLSAWGSHTIVACFPRARLAAGSSSLVRVPFVREAVDDFFLPTGMRPPAP